MRSHLEDWGSPRRPLKLRGRMKTAFSLLQVLAVAFAAVALPPMISKAAPGDPISIDGEGEFPQAITACAFNDSTLPGGTVYCAQRLGTNVDVDVSMGLYIKQATIRVIDELDQPVTDPVKANYFRDLWTMNVLARPILTRSIPADADMDVLGEADEYSTYEEVCPPRRLTEMADSETCDMGLLRGGTTSADSGEPTYERTYLIGMTEADDGTNQTEYAGWGLVFDMIFVAEIPARDPCPSTRILVSEDEPGVCTTPIYIRP